MKMYELASEYSRQKYKNIKAIKTGEIRGPKKGEWFLSGAIGEAYQAPNDLSVPYHIAKLVRVEHTYRIIGEV